MKKILILILISLAACSSDNSSKILSDFVKNDYLLMLEDDNRKAAFSGMFLEQSYDDQVFFGVTVIEPEGEDDFLVLTSDCKVNDGILTITTCGGLGQLFNPNSDSDFIYQELKDEYYYYGIIIGRYDVIKYQDIKIDSQIAEIELNGEKVNLTSWTMKLDSSEEFSDEFLQYK